jgi:hypothetical protein
VRDAHPARQVASGEYPHPPVLFAQGVAPPGDPERAFDRMARRLLDAFDPEPVGIFGPEPVGIFGPEW